MYILLALSGFYGLLSFNILTQIEEAKKKIDSLEKIIKENEEKIKDSEEKIAYMYKKISESDIIFFEK
jgi:peptidoglycan hydrolase CwlO-like protein